MLGLACKLLTQDGVLRRDTNRTSVQVTLAHHDTAHRNEGSRRKAKLFGTKETRDGHITTRAELTIRLHDHTTAQVIEHKRLMCLSETQFPRQTGKLDTCPARSTRTTIMTRNEDMISLGFGYTSGNDTHTNLRHELHADARTWVGALEVVDQLLQVLD